MNYYIEVTLMENDQFSPYELWSQLYPQLHLALVEAKNADNKVSIGFSFPQYRFHQDISDVLHLHQICFLSMRCALPAHRGRSCSFACKDFFL